MVAEPRQGVGIERIRVAPGGVLGWGPQGAQILDDGRLALAITEQIAAAVPIVEAQAVMGEDLVQDLDAVVPIPSACTLVITASCGCSRVGVLEATVGPMALSQE